MLESAGQARKLPRDEYRSNLGSLHDRLYQVQKTCWESGIGSIVVFEGWDAAGKGSAISALTRRLEPRGFRLHPIQPPRSLELEMPWLWRFWNRLPNYGEMAIFDQSWYGRVYQDRVARLTSERECEQGFGDITEFERTLTADGYVLIKVFLHISRQEQARRLKRLARDPLCDWQVSADVWRRHKLYAEHRTAAEEMLARTGTEWGPWTIVDATSRRRANMRVFETVIRGLEDGLQRRGIQAPGREPAGVTGE